MNERPSAATDRADPTESSARRGAAAGESPSGESPAGDSEAPDPATLYGTPNALAGHYSAFKVSERLLLTGHSHQAWPDAALDGQTQAWLDAAAMADGKWDAVATKTSRVTEGFRALMGGCDGDFVMDSNTHALVVRFLSALPLRDRPRIVTTDGEFHSIRRQLDRLAEEGIEVVKVASNPVDSVPERLAGQVDDRTAAVMVSSVFYGTGLIAPSLAGVADACASHGAELLIDAYHALNVVPFTLAGIERAFVVAGGYKYCQLGEGNCVMRIPPDCTSRPVVTGWFSEFAELADRKNPGEVGYGRGAARFAGSTFDPTSAYRAASVFDFFLEQRLTVPFLRQVSQHQVGVLVNRFQALDLDPAVISVGSSVPLERRAGFLSLQASEAGMLHAALLERGVRTDFRGTSLRFGPAPYLSDAQLDEAMAVLGEVVRG